MLHRGKPRPHSRTWDQEDREDRGCMFSLINSITHPFLMSTVFGIEGHMVLCLAQDINLVLGRSGVPGGEEITNCLQLPAPPVRVFS